MNWKELKKLSEKKHLKIFRYLKKEFFDCDVRYNGLEGHDICIQFEENITWVEVKTCAKIVCNHRQRLGRIRFDRRHVYPYDVSQHDDLVSENGWYLFFVGNVMGKDRILFGVKAKDVPLDDNNKPQQLNWGRLSSISDSDWLDKLKEQVYK